MNYETKRKNEALLRNLKEPEAIVVKPLVQLANIRCIVDSLKAGEKTWTIKEIAARHNLSDATVYREFRGKLGCFKYRAKWVVTDTLYTQWLTDCVRKMPTKEESGSRSTQQHEAAS
jgi:AraC-like DNA-binding protein